MKTSESAHRPRLSAPPLPEWFVEQRLLASTLEREADRRDQLLRALDRRRAAEPPFNGESR